MAIDSTAFADYQAPVSAKDDGIDPSLFHLVGVNKEESEHLAAEPYSYWKSVFRVFMKSTAARIAILSLFIMIIGMVVFPLMAYDGAYSSNLVLRNLGPSSEHWFGTDNIGRDLWYCCWKGLGKSMLLALLIATINIVMGTLIGLAWGFFRKLDPIMIEIYNLISNIPSLLLYMLLIYVFTYAFPDINTEGRFIICLVLFDWIGISLLIRNNTIIITNREYNIASYTLGTPARRIMTRNLLPHLLAIIITEFSLLIPGVISNEVAMTYFGVGLDRKGITIGALLENGLKQFPQYSWEMLFPALMLAIVIFTFYLLGLALSDALDPKKHR